MAKQPLILLIDGNSLMHRAFHALPPLMTRKTGEETGAIYGFTRMLLKALNDYKPDYCAVAFDRKEKTFRHIKYKEYKATRPETPPALVTQFERVKQLIAALNIPAFDAQGYEADDVLGTLALLACNQGLESIVVTGDNDAFQLISPCVKVLTPGKTLNDISFYNEQAVQDRFGISPKQIPDYKGLKGDTSDNIPGVPGVGEKTATKLIQQFGSIEGIYQDIEKVGQEKLRKTLQENKELALHSKELATIVTNIPLTLELHACKTNIYDKQKVADVFRELEFTRLLDSLPGIYNSKAEEISTNLSSRENEAIEKMNDYQKILTLAEAEQRVQGLISSPSVAVWLDVMPKNIQQTPVIYGIAFSSQPNKAYYLSLSDTKIPQESAITLVRTLLEHSGVGKIMHDAKESMSYLSEYSIKLNNLIFDTMIAGHLLGEKALDIKTMALSHLNIDLSTGGSLNKSLELFSLNKEAGSDGKNKAMMADVIAKLKEALEPNLQKEQLGKLYTELELPLIFVLARMEKIGVKLDTNITREISRELDAQLTYAEKMIYEQVGHKFNINSPQQLSSILFEELRLPSARKTRTGYSTNASVLEDLKGVHPVVEHILEYRRLVKLKSTYIDVLPTLINPRTGRVHTNFNLTATTTGRLSSSNPNLQNIPLKGDWGKKIRRAFIAEPPCVLLAGDYSQIDLRILAHLSQDKSLLAAFRQDKDIHAATAAELFGVPLDKITPDMRRVAKVVNFGVIYGMSDYGLEQATELSRSEASHFITAYFQKYPGVQDYLERTKQQVRDTGYVNTLLGRRRYVPEIKSLNRQVIEAGERMAINMPVQGTAADLVKLAMVQIQDIMDKQSLQSKMILQIHDELIFEVIPHELDTMKKLVKSVMSNAMQLSIPLKVALKAGSNWGDMEESADISISSETK